MQTLSMILAILAAMTLLVACEGQDPAGPVVNNSGSDNTFCINSRTQDVNCTVPAPVVVPPVVIAPPATE